VKTPPPSISFWSLRSDLRSERSKTKDSLSLVTDATSLRGVSIQFYCYTVPAIFDYGDRSPLNMIAELEVPEYGKEILTKLLNEYGDQWHKELDDFYSKDDPKWEIDPKFIDSATGLAKVDLSIEDQQEINKSLKNDSRPFIEYEDFLDNIIHWLTRDEIDEEVDENQVKEWNVAYLLKDWRDRRIEYWTRIKGLSEPKARNQTYLDIEKLNLGGKECTCHTCGVFFYDNIPDLYHHNGVKELYCSVNCETKASFDCIVCAENYVVGLPHSSLFDKLRILRLQGICSLDCREVFKTEKALESKYISSARRRAIKYGVAFDETITRKLVFEKENGRCYLCQIETHLEHSEENYEPKLSTVDHIIPISKGGPHNWENVRNCCLKCNITKHDRIY
jgi:hypothetical protein